MEPNPTLAEQAALVALSPGRRRLRGGDLHATVNAAVLLELWLAGHVTGDSRARVAGDPRARQETRNLPPEQVEMLRRIHAARKPRPWRTWVRKESRRTWATLATRMGTAGLVRAERHRFLGFTYLQVTVRDTHRAEDLVARCRATVENQGVPADQLTRTDVGLAALVAAAEFGAVVPWTVRRTYRARIAELTERSGPAPVALRKVLRERRASAA